MGDHAAFVGRAGGGAGLPTITCKCKRCPLTVAGSARAAAVTATACR
ncbi:hypothetical protein PC116_g14169 [Phytophthora cactorum]|uniref:Uncharacterized protein n=1 Tax=Phytophthora cactorum TaxID=29920 RepID=A0A8T1KLU8_9STRA|nr:hypothetical protein PC114_g14342 [Phytophthora cactorum]KAG2949661.1 hypothetical protein PC117_g5063 [Phytophthora cactorum]KAG3014776.1 hypothetical protein PC119_g12036 [Phytophthora cactorum]KAG3166848.1 hypothetical protein C6341_g11901 [Phytophthora cactorum]KAG4237777.1 hypothetical protein PC116_g14169 [Phytophthora cactorum]